MPVPAKLFLMDRALITGLLQRIERGQPSDEVYRDVPDKRYVYDRGAALRIDGGALRNDAYAGSIMPRDFPGCTSLSPVQIRGDGNCLFRSASVLATGKEDDHLELRLRTSIELSLNARFYATGLVRLGIDMESSGCSLSAASLLLATLSDVTESGLLCCHW